jgi:hypothetical protein
LRALIEKLLLWLKLRILRKPRLLKKPGTFVPLILFVVLLLFAGFFALTQESPDGLSGPDRSGPVPDEQEMALNFYDEEGFKDVWTPPGPPRWFRSNAGGMMLEETPSRMSALRNKYALVVDYISPAEIEPLLLPYYEDDYSVEIRILYEEGSEIRRQWLFQDISGVFRINAVFRSMPDIQPVEESAEESSIVTFSEPGGGEDAELLSSLGEESVAELAETTLPDAEPEEAEFVAAPPLPHDGMPDMDITHVTSLIGETALSTGFIERYNANAQIIEDRWLFDDDSVIMIRYSYNGNILLKAETDKMISGSEFKAVYSDHYRYNRSYSLRHIERFYHVGSVAEPVRLTFPGRVLSAAANVNFFEEKLSVVTDFMGNYFVDEGFRVIYDTDNRGRVLSQTMVDKNNESVWVIKNTWVGDRIVSSFKTEGDDEKLTEYEYNDGGERIIQRDIHNGVLERMVYIKGANETEEIYMNGVLVMKAYWEDGRKISEERVRRR